MTRRCVNVVQDVNIAPRLSIAPWLQLSQAAVCTGRTGMGNKAGRDPNSSPQKGGTSGRKSMIHAFISSFAHSFDTSLEARACGNDSMNNKHTFFCCHGVCILVGEEGTVNKQTSRETGVSHCREVSGLPGHMFQRRCDGLKACVPSSSYVETVPLRTMELAVRVLQGH